MRERISQFGRWLKQLPTQLYTPRELRAIALFLLIGLGVLTYRHGRHLLYQQIPSARSAAGSTAIRRQDSVFAALSHQADLRDSLFFSLPEDSLLPVSVRKQLEHHSKEESLRLASISLNRSGKEDLVRLPTVGPATAELILEYRSVRGRFSSIEELTNVRGFGAKRLARVRRFLRLD
jgi:competence ComEA-like helix-hairpin-helix protein